MLFRFAIAEEEYGIPIDRVQEINRMTSVTHLPGTPEFVEGIISLRGTLIPIVDLRKRLGFPSREHTSDTRIVVTDAGTRRIGLVADRVSEVSRIPAEKIEKAPEMGESIDAGSISGVGKDGDRLIVLLDLSRLVETAA